MDWAKAKTILITVFLLINTFLAYVIINDNIGNIGYVDSENIKHVTDYLAEKNIIIKGQIPDRKTDMFSINVKYKLFHKDDVARLIFSQEEKIAESVLDRIVTLKGKTVGVSIKDNRELNYSDNSIKPMSDINEKVCRKKIGEFLGRLGMKDDAVIRRWEEVEGYKKYTYSQSFKGALVYNSIMEFYVNDSGVSKARIIWFETVKQAGRKAVVISPAIALLAVPDYYKNTNYSSIEILEVQQGYYFGTGSGEQVDFSMVEGGTAFPVWKITTDRDTFYINAYNEKVEGVEKARE